ncbi:MAG: MBL fold metallo-hydrolase [Porphyromonadaceae bacterium]|jgi:phosphoribosyl 1,2-cyclic phosphate phosphodiesterase|nr:MBL fold metallo-hydrolase [Porphyromonadaceae bacterium]
MINSISDPDNLALSAKHTSSPAQGAITFLGTGTSTGVPQLGCSCPTCLSTDQRDKRLRTSAVISVNNKSILIDAGPDLRQQLITNKTHKLDAILLTHVHYDHVSGLDDVRPLGEMRIYGERKVLDQIKRNMPYCFGKYKFPGVPNLDLFEIDENEFTIDGLKITPIRVMHAKLPILGYRIGDIAYLTDVKTIDENEFSKLKNLKILVLSALRRTEHFSHLSLSEAIKLSKKIGANVTYFTHASHEIGLQSELDKELPKNIHFAYDNLTINF